jgi:hypothetical protein
MRPRTELALGIGILSALGVLAAAFGQRQNRTPPSDPRRSSYLSGPNGARGLSEALERLGIKVQRYRQRSARLEDLEGAPDGTRQALLVLDPSYDIDGATAGDLVRWSQHSDLVLAGPSADWAMRCFGFAVEERYPDSVAALSPGHGLGPTSPWVHAVLASTADTVVVDSAGVADEGIVSCTVPALSTPDTLLVSPGGRAIALRLTLAEAGTRVTLVADGRLFSNRALRYTDAGPVVLDMFAGRTYRAVFDEYLHGFGPSGSLLGSALGWSLHSPFGWASWQLGVIGVLALITGVSPLAGAFRFGPPSAPRGRRRRSPIEHVRALATALAAVHGQDVAVHAIVRGLWRRLAPAGRESGRAHRPQADMKAWLDQLSTSVRTAKGRKAVRTIKRLSEPPQPAGSVLEAANAVEDVWEELRP